MYNDIYFPIMSNIEFFRDTTKQPEYDNLIFDSGGYDLICSDNGTIFDVRYPYKPDEFRIPDTPINYVQLTAQEEGSTQTIPIIPPGKGRQYTVCFEYLINKLGLNEEKFIQFKNIKLTDYGKKRVDDYNNKTKDYLEFIEGIETFKNKILNNFQ